MEKNLRRSIDQDPQTALPLSRPAEQLESGRPRRRFLASDLGQKGNPDMPNQMLEFQYSSGRYFTLIYSDTGGLQHERGYSTLSEAEGAYEDLLARVTNGSLDPSQPVYREDLED